jgi:hypothetical protein
MMARHKEFNGNNSSGNKHLEKLFGMFLCEQSLNIQ